MAVIAHLRIPADSFELGRILELEASGTVELENMVPLGEKAVPFFSVSDEVRESFEQNVENHPSVERIIEVTRHDAERLYSLEWNVRRDVFLQGIVDLRGQLLSATGTVKTWEFEIRFPTHETLSEFQEYCSNAHIQLEVGRIYNPVRPGTGIWYGVTQPQRETLMRAVQGGYYSIPRQMSTQDLADVLDISDQAVTERLRRAIETLTTNTLIAMEEELDEEFE
ncbi:helix-turn-helix domain-containing protein [Natrarchaeobius sp. A-rgal3]|uniref:helix-turn-helix domain-containing protein n=1 Tax=Natrarchaeobius versutus TaxID=1679078 RepID=UPI00351060AE